MNIKFFTDTDTALIEFSDNDVYETKEVNENIYIDLDSGGNLVSITIEHAKNSTSFRELTYKEINSRTA